MTEEERTALLAEKFPVTVGGETRPGDIQPDMPMHTTFPPLIANDPARYDMFNTIIKQLLSNDKKLSDTMVSVADIDNIESALDNLAPIDSPAFTGTPTAPTAAVGTNNSQIATTKFVKDQDYATKDEVQEVADSIDFSSYATKDEVQEVADSIDFSPYATKANPTFTGTVTAPTLTVSNTLNIPGGQIWIS